MSGSGREALWDVREWLGVHPGCPGVVGRLSRMSGVVGRPSQMSKSCREALSEGGLPRCPGVVGRPSQMSERGREALRDVQEWL